MNKHIFLAKTKGIYSFISCLFGVYFLGINAKRGSLLLKKKNLGVNVIIFFFKKNYINYLCSVQLVEYRRRNLTMNH